MIWRAKMTKELSLLPKNLLLTILLKQVNKAILILRKSFGNFTEKDTFLTTSRKTWVNLKLSFKWLEALYLRNPTSSWCQGAVVNHSVLRSQQVLQCPLTFYKRQNLATINNCRQWMPSKVVTVRSHNLLRTLTHLICQSLKSWCSRYKNR